MIFSYIGGLRKDLAIYLESRLGAPSEQIVLITTMASVIPFSLLNYLIHNRKARLLYSLIVGFILHYSIYGIHSLHTVFGTIVSYYFVKYFCRKISPFYLLIGTMLHLSILNIIRMIVDFGGWAIDDISTIYMVAVAKISSFGFSYSDGDKDPLTIKSSHQRKMIIKEMPSLLEYASYIYFFPTTIIGPFVEYMDFIHFINEEEVYTNLNSKIPYIFKEACKKLGMAVFFIIFFVLYSDIYPMDGVGKAEFRVKYPEWWRRFIYMYLCGPVGRAKYYIAWGLTYSALVFSGMSYGEDFKEIEVIKNGEKIKEKRIVPNVDKGSYGSVIYNEIGMNPILKMNYWNQTIHIWLKYNVHIRSLIALDNSKKYKGNKNNKIMASFITFIFSAIWHGFYASYFFCFFLYYLFQESGAFLNQIGFYKFVDDHSFLWPFIILKTTFFNDIIGSMFFCLEIKTTKEILINFYGLPATAIIGFYILIIFLRGKLKRKDKKKTV